MPKKLHLTPEEREARKVAKAASMKAWRAANAAHVSTYNHAYHLAHIEQRHADWKNYYGDHKDELYEKKKVYTSAHPEKVKAWEHAKRGRINADPATREAKLAYHREYHHEHRETANALRKTRFHTAYHADLEATRAKARAKRQQQGESYNVYLRAYRQRTITRRRALQRGANKRRRARLNAAPINNLTEAEWEQIKAHYGHCCVYCGRHMQRLTQDHLTPLSKGGSHTKHNVVPACLSCNSKKKTGPVLKPVQPLLL